MNKELEYINEMYAELNDSAKWHKKVSTIKQTLTPPTADEICKALSEYTKNVVEYYKEDNVFAYEFRFMNEDRICIMAGCMDNKVDIGTWNYPPHLIIMLGQFYESLEE